MTDDAALWAIAEDQSPFGKRMNIRFLSVSPDRLEAEMSVLPEFGNRNGVMHGGAVMGLADTLGGAATFLNLAPGTTTTTIESKTNFFAAIAIGETVRAVCTPLHRGRTTMVWQTEILRQDGRRAAMVTQTQIVLPRR